MILQGSNLPILIIFDDDLDDVADMVVSLWRRKGQELKRWETNDLAIEGNTVTLPITEAETAALPEGYNTLEVKGLDENGYTIFWEDVQVLVGDRKDKGIMITGG